MILQLFYFSSRVKWAIKNIKEKNSAANTELFGKRTAAIELRTNITSPPPPEPPNIIKRKGEKETMHALNKAKSFNPKSGYHLEQNKMSEKNKQ
jgi:hypothetical protein